MIWAEEVAEVLDPLLEESGGYDEGFGPLTATVPQARWVDAVTLTRDALGCTFFDWLSAVDELAEGFSVLCHLASFGSSATDRSGSPEGSQTNRGEGGVRHLLLRATVPRDDPTLPSVVGVFAGAAWHERETTEMFGIRFTGAPEPPTRHLLLPEEFEGHPLRKDFVLASRVAKPWPGAKEPGESEEGGSPSRRRTRPPGVPEPETWGPREPASPAPDPLAHAQPGAARPRRARPARGQAEQEQIEQEQTDG